ncbi:MAG: hypothetical protein LBS57_02490 [Treponema sp.]|jgi:hypothetical protein|nr:hypothetical protein [Treponema sp.]
MRKAVKIFSVLLILLTATLFITGCPNGTPEEEGGYKNPTESSTEFKTYYIKAVDASREAPWNDIHGVERLHLHAPAGSAFVIQKVFVSNTMTEDVPSDAVVWYDFTKGNEPTDYETGNYGGEIVAGTVADGTWSLDNSQGAGEVYPGNLGLALDDKAYIGFVIKNVSQTAVFDNIQLEFRTTGDAVVSSKPCAYYFGFSIIPDPEEPPSTDLSEWTPVYFELTGENGLDTAINRFHFHVNTGSIEIQKVLVNNTKTMTSAVTVLDFTAADGGKDGYPYFANQDYNYDYSFDTALIEDGGTADGRYSLTGTGDYIYGENFGSGAAYANTASYWIFIIRSVDGLGDVRFGAFNGGDEIAVIRFDSLEFDE